MPVGSAGTGAAGIASAARTERPFIARMIHAFALPIILFWLVVVVMLSVFVPSLEVVGQERSVLLSPKNAPSLVRAETHRPLVRRGRDRQREVDGDTAYIVWKAETANNLFEIGSDTFIVKNGKIVTQTFAGKISPKN